jgi:ubiquinone/menaquinone biosynthesis C-methylase UbiE
MRRLYDRLVVPHLVHWGMQSAQLAKWRAETVADAHGRVLEIGIGSGLNFPHYGREVREVVGVDPAPALLRRAAKAGGWMPFKIRLLCQSAEHLPYPDQSFDCAVTTWTLCSIPDPVAALAEARRVLRPRGRLLFVEHGAAMGEPGLERWQRRLTPAWRCIAGGCHLDRRQDELIEAAGFVIEKLETGHLLEAPRLVSYLYRGSAKA